MGRWIVKGLFKFYDRSGLPLSDIFDYCLEKNYQPCWLSFIKECRRQGQADKTIKSRLGEAILDVYGKEYWNIVLVVLTKNKILK
jgi:hypothetical protein